MIALTVATQLIAQCPPPRAESVYFGYQTQGKGIFNNKIKKIGKMSKCLIFYFRMYDSICELSKKRSIFSPTHPKILEN